MSADRTVVETESGAVRGQREGSVTVFRGVPYAEPPVGVRRWSAAAPHRSWSGVRDATADGPTSVQSVRGPFQSILGDTTGASEMDEDCLSLTIWSPAADDSRRPVMVWLHGGGFITGSGSWEIYSGAGLAASADLVVVGVNYRTGPLGFLYIGDDDPAGGNFGLTDQVRALEWIADNIERFGGDPTQLTLFGQSAGAWSIAAMLADPHRVPFTRAILQSPPLGLVERSHAEATEVTELVCVATGVGTVDELRTVPATQLLASTPMVMGHLAKWGELTLPFRPILGGALTAAPLLPTLLNSVTDVDVIVGWTKREMSFFYAPNPAMGDATREQVLGRLAMTFGDRAVKAYEAYESCHGQRQPIDVLMNYERDKLFRMPSLELAAARNKQGSATCVTQFDLPLSLAPLSSTHCVELPFVFGTAEAWEIAGGDLAAGIDFARHAAPLTANVRGRWSAFARHGLSALPDCSARSTQ